MRTIVIPALCALALFATSTLSYAGVPINTEKSVAEATMDRDSTVIADAWQEDATPVWY